MKKNNRIAPEGRNWGLVFICSILIIISLVLIISAFGYMNIFGWWSLLIGLTGVTTLVASIMSIVKNDPVWILLGLLLPG